ncbi:hypothetical protein RvY_17171 [Ramazzottius varieornatus]|uniref:Uncharacterized protein n=1 Tax=Ramazzottius varieornatus TaxID=947166 RepID=A0A1D1W173_RAMVA|nr:hypothetical protein RvY_17171 [Ramazzottius varieornatus]
MEPSFCSHFLYLLIASGLISTVASQNGTTPTCTASLQPLLSDPNSQSNTASILITSPTDNSQEFTCFAGTTGYDSSGISCHALNCPAPGYGPGYGRGPQGPYGNPYGGPGNGQLGHSSISVGPLVAHAETPYPCWKLKQIRLNNYVYMVCFVKGYATMLYQVVFKEQGGLELNHYEALPYTHLTAVGKGTFTAENSYQCIAAVYSSFADGCCKEENGISNPANELASIFTICPNTYKWYFCGNINIKNTIDVTVWWAQMTLHAIFIQQREEQICLPITIVPPLSLPLLNCTTYTTTSLVQFAISPDIDKNVCPSRLEQGIDVIGLLPNLTVTIGDLYPLCGVRKTVIIATSNATILCAAVDVNTIGRTCPPLGSLPTAQIYSSFCLLYDASANTILSSKVAFLDGAIAATDIFFLKGNVDCCQFVVTVGPGQQFLVHSLQSIIASLLSQLAPETVALSNINLQHLFNSASSCSLSGPKCCGGSTTCLSCTRPTRFGDKHLAELNCGSSGSHPASSSAGYPGVITYGDDTNNANSMKYNASAPAYGLQPMVRGPYGGPGPILYAGGPRPLNYSAPIVGVYGPAGAPHMQMQMQYGLPPGPYQGVPMQTAQQPIYGIRYGA